MVYRTKCRKWGAFAVCICLICIAAYYFYNQGKQDYFKEPHVFFVETASSFKLNARQACAVESAARHNPSMHVYVLMTPPDTIEYSHILIKKLQAIPNVHLLKIDIGAFVQGSPVSKWYEQGKWKESKWKVTHVSDGLRFLLLWKYGGIYLDMDVITLRSLESLRNTAVASTNWIGIESAVLAFDKNHTLMRNCVDDFTQNYDPYQFAVNGPLLIAANVQKFCNKSMDKDIGNGCAVRILPPEAAYPIPYQDWEEYFVESHVKNVEEHFNSSYVIHVWNLLSSHYVSKVGVNSLYELAMKQHCPSVYDNVLDYGSF